MRDRKRPERIDDLRLHACLRMRRSDGSIAPWSFVDGNKAVEAVVSGPFIANGLPSILGAAVEGVGLAQSPEPIVAGAIREGRLVRVLEPFAPTAPGVFSELDEHYGLPFVGRIEEANEYFRTKLQSLLDTA